MPREQVADVLDPKTSFRERSFSALARSLSISSVEGCDGSICGQHGAGHNDQNRAKLLEAHVSMDLAYAGDFSRGLTPSIDRIAPPEADLCWRKLAMLQKRASTGEM
jgi:hypothetical protein